MNEISENPTKLLLHACCGPCSIEPVKLLRERGIEPSIYYSNSNIAPADEYAHRLDVISKWAADENIAFEEGEYTPFAWEQTAGKIGRANRKARCRACYRQRFEASAAYAAENGFDALGSTLSISPYQYTQVIKEELERACNNAGIRAFFEDYSPYYKDSVADSKAAGMYRQNFCGCRISAEEAQEERAAAKEKRAAQKAERAAARAKQEALEAQAAAERKRQRAEYDAKQAKKRAVLKAMRDANKAPQPKD